MRGEQLDHGRRQCSIQTKASDVSVRRFGAGEMRIEDWCRDLSRLSFFLLGTSAVTSPAESDFSTAACSGPAEPWN